MRLWVVFLEGYEALVTHPSFDNFVLLSSGFSYQSVCERVFLDSGSIDGDGCWSWFLTKCSRNLIWCSFWRTIFSSWKWDPTIVSSRTIWTRRTTCISFSSSEILTSALLRSHRRAIPKWYGILHPVDQARYVQRLRLQRWVHLRSPGCVSSLITGTIRGGGCYLGLWTCGWAGRESFPALPLRRKKCLAQL